MDTTTAPDRATFTNPVLRARLGLVRLLQVVDELEAAVARGDDYTVAHLARVAQEKLTLTEAAVWEAVGAPAVERERARQHAAHVEQGADAWADAMDDAQAAAGMAQYQAEGR